MLGRCIYIFFFASSWGPVAWVVTGELFPLKVRAKCLSMTTASNWLLNWAIAYSTPYLVDADHANLQSKVFFIWGSFCFVCIAFVYFMIYETKGKSMIPSIILAGSYNTTFHIQALGLRGLHTLECGVGVLCSTNQIHDPIFELKTNHVY